MAKNTVGLRLDPEIQERLRSLGKLKDRSPHYLMKEAVSRYLDEEEENEAERALIQERWDRFSITGEVIDHDIVKAWANSLP